MLHVDIHSQPKGSDIEAHRSVYMNMMLVLFSLPQLFETVKGMPLFMISNGILKLLCQIIATTCDLTLSRYMYSAHVIYMY